MDVLLRLYPTYLYSSVTFTLKTHCWGLRGLTQQHNAIAVLQAKMCKWLEDNAALFEYLDSFEC